MHLPILLSSCQLASDLISARLRSSCRARLASLAVAVLAAGMACQAAATSEGSPADIVSTSIYFPSGSASLKPDFMHNGMRLDEFIHRISALEADISLVCRVERPGQQVNTVVETVVETTETVETVETTTETTTVETSTVTSDTGSDRKPFYMSLSTNMLYDALLVPNIGAEFYLGKNLSVTANWMYGWWSKNNRHRYWRIYGGDLAVRYWFGKAAKEKPLTGHHAGVYGTIFTYDFEFGGRGQMGGKPGGSLWERAQYAVGLEYGYSLPIARRLNLDFTLGVGYMGGTYYDYRPVDGHYMWQKTVRRHWFGPTKLEVSLVWLIGHGNANKSKGGGR